MNTIQSHDTQLTIDDQLKYTIYTDFIVEHSEVQPLDHRIVKKFTSLAKSPVTTTHIYDPTLSNGILETKSNSRNKQKRNISHI